MSSRRVDAGSNSTARRNDHMNNIDAGEIPTAAVPPGPPPDLAAAAAADDDDDTDGDATTTNTTTVVDPRPRPILPCWVEELADRLHHTSVPPIRNLNLNIRKLTFPMLSCLLKPIQSNNTTIEALNFTSSFRQSSSSSSTSRITTNTTSTGRTRNNVDAMMSLLCHSIQHHPSLKKLHLSYNNLQSVPDIDVLLLGQNKLQELYLDHNVIDNKTVLKIAQALRQKQQKICHSCDDIDIDGTSMFSLKVLDLSSNNKHLDDSSGVAIAKSLASIRIQQQQQQGDVVHNTSNGIEPGQCQSAIESSSLLSSSYVVRSSPLRSLGLTRCNLGPKTATALLQSLDGGNNVTLCQLQLDQNPDMPQHMVAKIQHFVKANRCGRYLLRLIDESSRNDHPDGKRNDLFPSPPSLLSRRSEQSTTTITTIKALIPRVMEKLDHDMVFFFLREKPSLIPSRA